MLTLSCRSRAAISRKIGWIGAIKCIEISKSEVSRVFYGDGAIVCAYEDTNLEFCVVDRETLTSTCIGEFNVIAAAINGERVIFADKKAKKCDIYEVRVNGCVKKIGECGHIHTILADDEHFYLIDEFGYTKRGKSGLSRVERYIADPAEYSFAVYDGEVYAMCNKGGVVVIRMMDGREFPLDVGVARCELLHVFNRGEKGVDLIVGVGSTVEVCRWYWEQNILNISDVYASEWYAPLSALSTTLKVIYAAYGCVLIRSGERLEALDVEGEVEGLWMSADEKILIADLAESIEIYS